MLLVVENGGISLPFEGTCPCHLAPESLLAWPGRAYWRIASSSLAQALFLHEEWPRTGDGQATGWSFGENMLRGE